ncbi:MAG: DnaD domain protein [Oscillospiraceae bacterium]
MEIQLNGGKCSSFIAVPTEVIDGHLSKVSGIYIKVLLAVIRENEVNLKKLSSTLSIPESDVSEAINYWISNEILTAETRIEPVKETKARKTISEVISVSDMTAEAVLEQAEKDSQVKFLLCTAESLYGRPLTSTEQKGLVYIYQYMGLPADVVIMVVEYCISTNRPHFNYIQKMCAQWADDEINTHSRAEEAIKKLDSGKTHEGQVRAVFGIQDRALTPANKKYISQWFDEYGFDIEMIKIAYERTVDRIEKLSFPYINKILMSWRESGIRTADDLATKEKPRSGQYTTSGKKSTASYNLEEFDRLGFQIPKLD